MLDKHSAHIKLLQSCLDLYNPLDRSPSCSSGYGILRQEYWSELSFPSPGDLSNPEIEPTSLMSPAEAGGLFTTSTTWEAPDEASLVALLLKNLPEMQETPV